MHIVKACKIGLKKAIKKTAFSGEFIEVPSHVKGIGTSTQLVRFAKKNGFTVVVQTKELSRFLKNHFKYKNIMTVQELKECKENITIVFDVGVDVYKFKKLAHVNIATGFYSTNLVFR